MTSWLYVFSTGHYTDCPRWALQLVKDVREQAAREGRDTSIRAACREVARMLEDYWPC